MSDPRKNLPSASSIERYALCPGAWNAEQGQPREENKWAEMGDRVHAALASPEAKEVLTDAEQETYDMAEALAAKLKAHHFEGHTNIRTVSEARLWLYDKDQWPLLSGQFDRIYICNDSATGIICDFKCGRNEATEAASNWQLLTLAVLASIAYGLNRVVVAIIQPWVKGQVTVTEYNKDELMVGEIRLREIVAKLKDPNAPRIPGEKQCAFCRAKSVCPEAHKETFALATVQLMSLQPLELAGILDKCAIAKKIIKSCEDRAKALIASGAEIPGWQLKPGAIQRPITNPTEVFTRASRLGVEQAAFLKCVDIGKGALKDALKEATGKKGKELEADLEACIAGCIEEKQNAPSLERIK